MDTQIKRVVEEIEDVFGKVKHRVTELPARVELHHLLYKGHIPTEAINPSNLLLALRKSKSGDDDQLHGILHLLSSGHGLTSMGTNRWRTLLSEMENLVRTRYKI